MDGRRLVSPKSIRAGLAAGVAIAVRHEPTGLVYGVRLAVDGSSHGPFDKMVLNFRFVGIP